MYVRKIISICFVMFLLMPVIFVLAVSPTVETNDASEITSTTAQLNGNITNDGGSDCYAWFQLGDPLEDYDKQNYIGHNLAGPTAWTTIENKIVAGKFMSNLVDPNTEDSMELTAKHMRVKLYASAPHKVKCAIYDAGGDLITNGETEEKTISESGIYIFNFTTPPQFNSLEYYFIAVWANSTDGQCAVYVSSDEVNLYRHDQTYNGFPSHITFSYLLAYKPMIKCVYSYNYSSSTGETIDSHIDDLEPGTVYQYRIVANNSDGMTYGDNKTFLTLPEEPSLSFDSRNRTQINLTWTKGDGANNTYVERNTIESYERGEGTEIYNGTGTYFNDTNLEHCIMYYYKAWSYAENGALHQWSTGDGINLRTDCNTLPCLTNISVTPETGYESQTEFTFNVTYSDEDADDPEEMRILLNLGTWSINETMTWVSGDNETGANYTYNTTFPSAGTYKLRYSAYDGFEWNTTSKYDVYVDMNVSFDINFPIYLEVGQYIFAEGTINTNNNPINNTWVYTRLKDSADWSDVPYSDMKFYVNDEGYYKYTFSTSTMIPGIYYIIANFTHSGSEYTTNQTFYLSHPGGPGHAITSVYFMHYNVNTGIGIPYESFKTYVNSTSVISSSDRIYGNEYHNAYTGQTLYYRIDDYFDNQVYPTTGTYESVEITEVDQFIDIPIEWYSFSVKNMNSSIVRFTVANGSKTYTRYIYPYDSFYWELLPGAYNITLQYYNQDTELLENTIETNVTISNDTYYWIKGYDFEDIIDEGTMLYYTIFDMNSGSQLGDDFYKVYVSTNETMSESDRVKGGKFKTVKGTTLYYEVRDYWNNTIYNNTYINITQTKTFLDIGIPLNQFLIKNTNNTIVYMRITNGDFSDPANQTWYNRWIPPQESAELFLRSAIYNISIEYYYTHNASLARFENLSNYEINQDIFFVINGTNAWLYLNFYNTNDGIGMPAETLKYYINGVRIPSTLDRIDTYIGSTLNIVVKDYYNNHLYDSNLTITSPLTYLDLGMAFYSYKFSNTKNDYYVVGFKKNGSSLWWEKIVCPYDTIEFLPPIGNYSIRVYNYSVNQSVFYLAQFNDIVNSSKAYLIYGTNWTTNISLMLESEQQLIAQLTNATEDFNYTNSLLAEVLQDWTYTNQTIQSVLEQFRLPHEWMIPGVNYTVNDTSPPVSSISAYVAFDGSLQVEWACSDNTPLGVSHVDLYYKVSNASYWRNWSMDTSQSGTKRYTGSLSEGTTYWFRALGTDSNGNAESPTDANTVNITYYGYEVPITVNPILPITTTTLFAIIIIMIFAILIIVGTAAWKRKKEEQRYRRPVRREPLR